MGVASDFPDIVEGEHSSLLGIKDGEGYGTIPDYYGKKRIGFLYSVVLHVNNCMGPAMVIFPLLFQQAGFVAPLLILSLLFVLSSFCSSMVCEAIRQIPGNAQFKRRKEFNATVKHYFCDGPTRIRGGVFVYRICQIFFNVNLQALNIASIIIGSQVMDNFIAWCFGKTFALQYIPSFQFLQGAVVEGDPFFGNYFCISIGFVASLVICIPMAIINLDDNKWFQYISCVVLLATTGALLGYFCSLGLDVSNAPAFGTNYSKVLGTCIFAYAFVVSMPSWVNEKQPSVNVNLAIWPSTGVGFVLKAVFGLLGAWAIASIGTANIMELLTSQQSSPFYAKLAVYAFNVGTIIPGIPPFCIMVRYNLTNDKLCGNAAAVFWGVIAPWIFALFFCHGKGFMYIVNWSALISMGFINFVIPPLLYKMAQDQKKLLLQPTDSSVPFDAAIHHMKELYNGDDGNDTVMPPCMVKQHIDEKTGRVETTERGMSGRTLAIVIAWVMVLLILASIGNALYFLIVKKKDIVNATMLFKQIFRLPS